MGPESPSPYPQVPATCPYPELTPSSSPDPLQLPEDPSSSWSVIGAIYFIKTTSKFHTPDGRHEVSFFMTSHNSWGTPETHYYLELSAVCMWTDNKLLCVRDRTGLVVMKSSDVTIQRLGYQAIVICKPLLYIFKFLFNIIFLSETASSIWIIPKDLPLEYFMNLPLLHP